MRYFLSLLFSLNLALAQKFVYVSSLEPDTPTVSKLFLYQEGENTPLTPQLDDAAYDPVPSPDGKQIAYLEHSLVGSWSLVVIDLEGNEVSRWELPISTGSSRPAGGFYPTWLDAATLLVNVPNKDAWDIYRFTKNAEPEFVTIGFSIFLSPDKTQLLTQVGERPVKVDLKTNQNELLPEGQVWGWQDDSHIVLLQNQTLYSIATTGAKKVLAKVGADFLTGFSWSSDRTKFAFGRMTDEGAFMQVYGGQEKMLEQPLAIAVDTLEWLDNDTLLVSYQQDEASNYDTVIATLTLDGTLTEIVNSEGADYMARLMK
jgi:hypothetical protein